MGCFYGEVPSKRVGEELQKMESRAAWKARAALEVCESDKDIFKILGFKITNNFLLKWCGSGFAVQHNNRQYLVSATHVITKDAKFSIEKKGKRVEFEIDEWICYDDVSLIRVKDNPFSNPFEVDMDLFYSLQNRLFAKEEIQCISYGYTPDGLRKTQGRILDIYTDNERKAAFMVSSNPIVGGMSGGVLMDNDGKAIGVVSAYINGPERWGMYLPISNLIEFMEVNTRTLTAQ